MSHIQNDIYIEDLAERRGLWLSEFGKDESDVLEDSTGEYILVENEKDEFDETDRVELPAQLQKTYVPF